MRRTARSYQPELARYLLDTKYNAEYVAGGYVEPALPRVIRGTVRVNF